MTGGAQHAEALLFDLDGCLVDSLGAICRCWERTLAAFGEPAPASALLAGLAGPPVDEVARRLLPDAGADRIAEVVAAYRRCSRAAAGEVPAYPGVPEMLAGLREAGVRLVIATSKSIEVAEPVLESLGLRDLFAGVCGTGVDELGASKSLVVARALALLAPTRPLALVGDRAHDVVGAHAHGLPAIGALWGYGAPGELASAGADLLVAAPDAVAGALDALLAGGRPR